MSGRLHIFMLPQDELQLKTLVEKLGIGSEVYGPSHAVHCGLDYLLDLSDKGQLSAEQVAEMCDVPDPVNYGHLTVFLRQGTVGRATKLMELHKINVFDYALSHLCALGFKWLLARLNEGPVDEVWMHNLTTVQPPKKVMYS